MIETNLARRLANRADARCVIMDDYLVFFRGAKEIGRTLIDNDFGYLRVSRHAVERILAEEDRKAADRIDGFDRDDLGESPDF